MAIAKKEPCKVKKLRYVLRVVIDVDAEDPSDASDLIERNRELGSCEVVDVTVVEESA